MNEKRNTRRAFLGQACTGTTSALAFLALGGKLALDGGLGEAKAVGTGGASSTHFLRPPGALAEDDFLATCIRCGRCADSCPNRAITAFTEASGRDLSAFPGRKELNTPVIFPRRQPCILCNGATGDTLLCTSACPTGALREVKRDAESIHALVSMGKAQVDTDLCYSYNGASCGACVRSCPFEGKALRAGLWEKPIIDPDLCVGCGLCERACLRYPQAIKIIPRGEA